MSRSRDNERSSTVTAAPQPTAMRAACVPTTPPPMTTTFAAGTPGTPPRRTPRPPDCLRSEDPAASIVIAGLIFFVCVPGYRRDFLGLFKRPNVVVVGLIALSKVLFSVSEAVTLYATLLTPVALVLLVNSFQHLFVFVFGIVLTLFFPRVAKESLGRMKMLQKGVGIGLMLVGGYVIIR